MLAAYGMALPPGTELHRYRLLEVLGVGGFGVTYLAEHVALGQRVAVKEYLPNEFALRDGTAVQPKSPTDRPAFEWGLERFLDEAKTLARFEHRNLVRVRDFFEANRTACMVMDYEEGEPLSEFLHRCGSLPEDELKRLLLPLVDGLGAVHEAGFLHRDIKPSNICVRKSDGSPVLLDFGAARYALGQKSRSLTAVASAGYAPPEQYESDGDQGPWTDVYGLSALCYRAITGEVPTEATHRMHQLVQGKPDPLPRLAQEGRDGYSPELLAAVDRGLAVAASKRPRTLAEWIDAWSSGGSRSSHPRGSANMPDGVGEPPRSPPSSTRRPGGAQRSPRRALRRDKRAFTSGSSRAGPVGEGHPPDAAPGPGPLFTSPDAAEATAPPVKAAEAAPLTDAAPGSQRRSRRARVIGWSAVAAALVVLVAVSTMVAVVEFNDNRALAELETLLERRPDPAVVGENGMTDLHWAALQGNAKAAAWLLKQGAAVDARTKDGGRGIGLFLDQKATDPATIARLSRLGLSEAFSPVGLGTFTFGLRGEETIRCGCSPLMLAASSSSPEVAELLLARGAEVNARDIYERTPLHWAAWVDSVAASELLLARGADVDPRTRGEPTPLHWAAWADSVAASELLLARGADVNPRDIYERTPLHWAAWADSVAMSELLLAHGAEVDARDNGQETPLHRAAWVDSVAMSELLLASGAAVDARDFERATPLHYAASRDSVAVSELLLARGAAVDARAFEVYRLGGPGCLSGRVTRSPTPLHLAACRASVGVAELLLARGAAVNARTSDGRTPLDLAPSYRISSFLRRHGAVASGRRR